MFIIDKIQLKGQLRIYNPETLATLDTQDTGRSQTTQHKTTNKTKTLATQSHGKPGMNSGAGEG